MHFCILLYPADMFEAFLESCFLLFFRREGNSVEVREKKEWRGRAMPNAPTYGGVYFP